MPIIKLVSFTILIGWVFKISSNSNLRKFPSHRIYPMSNIWTKCLRKYKKIFHSVRTFDRASMLPKKLISCLIISKFLN